MNAKVAAYNESIRLRLDAVACLDGLTEAQINWRPSLGEGNSAYALAAHPLCPGENLKPHHHEEAARVRRRQRPPTNPYRNRAYAAASAAAPRNAARHVIPSTDAPLAVLNS
jgi:hypothetical protein